MPPQWKLTAWAIKQETQTIPNHGANDGGNLRLCLDPAQDQKSIYLPLIEDYAARNKKKLVLERKFDLPQYALVDPTEIRAIQQRSRDADGFPFNASVIFHVSAVGFNRGLTIGTGGNVRANEKALDIELFGSMQGSIEAVNKVYIRKGAKFVGDIHCAGIVIEDGAYIKAGIDLSRQPAGEQHSPDNGANRSSSSFDLSESGPLRSLSGEVRLPGAMQ
jgi:hypothetical protein